MIIPAVKANGNLNSFLIIDKKSIPTVIIDEFFIKKISLAYNQSHIDGIVVIEQNKSTNYTVDYFNNDGTWETLCVNALRCIGLLLFKKYNFKNISISCGDGLHNIFIKNNSEIQVSMNKPEYRTDEIEVEGYKGYYLFAGAKHFVINYTNNWPDNNVLKSIAQKIRYNKYFENGVNVNFYKIINHSLDVITYEKGVENIMPSCASGSFACAYHNIFSNKLKNKDIYITNPSGNLFTYIDVDTNTYCISGPAEIEYETEILINE